MFGNNVNGRHIWPCYVIPVIRRPGFMIITPSFSSFSVVFSNPRFSNCSSTVNVGFVKLSLYGFCVNMVFKTNSLGVTFTAVVLWFSDTIAFSIRRSLSLYFSSRPPFLLPDDGFPSFVNGVLPQKTAALDTANKVAILVTDAPAKRALNSLPSSKIWQASHFAVLS